MKAVTTIDDILHPGYAPEQKRAEINAQIAMIDQMLDALKAPKAPAPQEKP